MRPNSSGRSRRSSRRGNQWNDPSFEQPRLHRDGERQRRHGEVQPAQPERRQPDEERGHRAGDRRGGDGEGEVDVPPRGARRRDRRAERDEGDLAEGDLPGPPGEHDEREDDDREDDDRRRLDDLIDAQEGRDRPQPGGHGDDDRDLRQPHRGQPAHGRRQRADRLDAAPRRRGVGVAAQGLLALQEQRDQHRGGHQRVGEGAGRCGSSGSRTPARRARRPSGRWSAAASSGR